MLSECKDWLAASRNAWRRDLAVLVLAAFASTLAACNGGTASTPTCMVNCYAVAGFYQPGTDFASTPHGVFVTMDVGQLTCDVNCTNENGFIHNYVLLGDTHLDNWVQMGYSTLDFGDTDPHVWAYYTEEDVNNKVTTIFLNTENATDVGQEVDFTVHTVAVGNQTTYYVAYQGPDGSQDNLWTPATPFAPGAAEAGEVLHGGHGEAADSVAYSGFNYTAKDLPFGDTSPADFPLELLGMGHVASDRPPYGVWVGFEGNPAVWFQTWCC